MPSKIGTGLCAPGIPKSVSFSRLESSEPSCLPTYQLTRRVNTPANKNSRTERVPDEICQPAKEPGQDEHLYKYIYSAFGGKGGGAVFRKLARNAPVAMQDVKMYYYITYARPRN